MDVIEVIQEKEAVCRPVLEALPQWFGIEEARERDISEADDLDMFACVDGKAATAFLTLRIHTQLNAEIHAMGVLPNWQRRELGTRLTQVAERHAASLGVYSLTVKTISPRKLDENYEGTRGFYRSRGFLPFEEFSTLWGSSNPCLMMIKHLRQ